MTIWSLINESFFSLLKKEFPDVIQEKKPNEESWTFIFNLNDPLKNAELKNQIFDIATKIFNDNFKKDSEERENLIKKYDKLEVDLENQYQETEQKINEQTEKLEKMQKQYTQLTDKASSKFKAYQEAYTKWSFKRLEEYQKLLKEKPNFDLKEIIEYAKSGKNLELQEIYLDFETKFKEYQELKDEVDKKNIEIQTAKQELEKTTNYYNELKKQIKKREIEDRPVFEYMIKDNFSRMGVFQKFCSKEDTIYCIEINSIK